MDKKVVNKLLDSFKTPFYVFDIDILKARVAYLKKMMPENVAICFAMKANPFLVGELNDVVDKYEVCSFGEYKICDELEVPKKKLVISGVYKDENSMEEMLNAHERIGTFTIESVNQIKLLDRLTKKKKIGINLLLRLSSGNQFGMREDEIEQILNDRKDYDYLNIRGIEYFSGTQKVLVKRIKKEIDYLDSYILHLQNDLGYVVEELEYGPGFPVEYFESNFDEKSYLEEIRDYIKKMNYQGKITLELGRSIAASCGAYFTKVVDMKKNHEGNFAILDGGMHHLVYYGQMMAMKKPELELWPKRSETNLEEWNLCGALCTINDLIVKKLKVADLALGDIFIFKNTGAYSMSEGISLFLSRDLPQVVFLKGKNMEVVRKDIKTYKLNMPNFERKVIHNG